METRKPETQKHHGLTVEELATAEMPLPKNCKEPFAGPNSRPISILPVIGKLFEGIIYKQIQQYFNDFSLNTDFQHAYRVGHSTATALTSLTDSWLQHIDKKEVVGAVLLDFSAAFDIIDHDLLIKKLKAYGFRITAIELLRSYLSDRQQCVVFTHCCVTHVLCNLITLECGIPQGSCLGPLLYSIFVNDIPYMLQNEGIVIYADDTTIFASSLSSEQVNKNLQKEIMLASEWVNENKLKLNVSKTKCLMLDSKHALRSNFKLSLSLNDTEIEQVREAKLLGVTIDETLSWTSHIGSIVTRMSRGISIIKNSASLLDESSLKIVIQSLVLSHLDYCPTVWSCASQKELSKLQLTQNRAARLALQCSIRKNVLKMHDRLSWLMVKDRLKCSLILFLKSIHSVGKPKCLYLQLVPTNNRHNHETRHAVNNRFTLPLPRTNSLRRTVLYRAVAEWNRLPPDLLLLESRSSFKNKLKKMFLER